MKKIDAMCASIGFALTQFVIFKCCGASFGIISAFPCAAIWRKILRSVGD